MYDRVDNVFIYAPETMQNKVCGLCGNYDGNKTNDLINPRGQRVSNVASWGEAWHDPMEERPVKHEPAVAGDQCDHLDNGQVDD